MKKTEQEDSFEKYVVLRFRSREELGKFYDLIETGEAELVRAGNEDQEESTENKSETGDRTMWSRIGAEKYDDKNAENNFLPGEKGKRGAP